MAINENIWGDGETWLNCMNSLCKTSAKTGYQLIDDTIPMNEPFDNSMCWCGVAQNLHKFYLAHSAITNNADFSPLVLQPLYNVTDVVNVPFLFAGGGTINEYYNTFQNVWGRWSNIGSLADGNMTWYLTGNCKPIFNLQLNKLIFVPTLTAFTNNDPDSNTYQSFSLSDWINSGHTTHPYLSQLFITPYNNHGTDENPDWQPCYDSYDNYEYFCPNLETSDYIQNIPDSNFTRQYYFTNQQDRKLTTLLMGCLQPRHGTYGTYRVVVDDDPSHYVSNADYVRYCRQYSQALIDDIRTQCAFLGVFFLGDYISSLNDMTLTHPSVYCGIIDDGGLTHGEYSHGEDNANQKQFDWSDTSESEYDPTNPPRVDPNAYTGEMGSGTLDYASPTAMYNIKGTDFINLVNKLWDAMLLVPAGDPIGDYCLDTFLTTNPIDSIVSLKFFPVSGTLGGSDTTIHLGKFDTEVNAKSLVTKQIKYDCGTYYPFPTFGNGYTNWIDRLVTITLYLPFCGVVELNPELYFNRGINVEYAIDLQTGNCSAFVSYEADNKKRVITDIASGNCAIDLPVTGIQHMTLDSQLYNATEQLKAMRVNNAIGGLQSLLGLSSAGGKGLQGGLSQGLGTGGKLWNMLHSESVAEYNLQHTQLPVKMIGTAGSATGAMCTLKPTIIFERPRLPDNTVFSEKAYAHTIGYACCISSTVGTFKGYTEFSNVDLSGVTATANEKDAILSALKNGVIL